MRKTLLTGILLLVAGTSAYAGPLHVALLPQASVTGDAIVLSRLLPLSASSALHQWADHVRLGASPSVGYERTLSRPEIAQAIRSTPFSGAEFAIPETVVVRREARTVSTEEICEILRRELQARGNSAAAGIRAQDVQMQLPLRIPPGSTGLHLKELTIDPLLGEMRFRLRAAGTSAAPELYGWLRLARRESGNLEFRGPGEDASNSKPIVATNRMAVLLLHSQNSETLLRVRALESGRLGDSIRVRIPGNGRTLVATVVAPDRLDLHF